MDNKDLIRQYVDTGLKISEHQFSQLNNNLKQSYLRKRTMAVFGQNYGEFSTYEYKYLDDDTKKKFIKKMIYSHEELHHSYFDNSSDDVRDYYINMVIDRNESLSVYEYKNISDDLKHKYMLSRVRQGKLLSSDQIEVSPPKILYDYMDGRIEAGRTLGDWEFENLPQNLKIKYIEQRIKDLRILDNQEYKFAPDRLKKTYIEERKNLKLSSHQLDNTPDDLAMFYFNQRVKQGWDLDVYEQDRYKEIKHEQ